MVRNPKPIVSITGGTPQGGELPSGVNRGIDRVMAIQRPAVLAYIRGLRRRNPNATPEQLVRILERRYVAAVTGGGAAVGATAVIPGVGTGLTLALSGVETAGFLEATALFAQSVSEVHGIAVDDPDRARALVMTMMLGREGSDLVRQLAGQLSGSGVARKVYWGELVTSSIPRAILVPLTERLRGTSHREGHSVRDRRRHRRRRKPHPEQEGGAVVADRVRADSRHVPAGARSSRTRHHGHLTGWRRPGRIPARDAPDQPERTYLGVPVVNDTAADGTATPQRPNSRRNAG
jgi:hypothetical protein